MDTRKQFINIIRDEIIKDISKVSTFKDVEDIIFPNLVNLASIHMQYWCGKNIDTPYAYDRLDEFYKKYRTVLFQPCDDMVRAIEPNVVFIDFTQDFTISYSDCVYESYTSGLSVLADMHTKTHTVDYITTEDSNITRNKLSIPIPLVDNRIVTRTGYLEIVGDIITRRKNPIYNAYEHYPIVNLTFTWDEVEPKNGGAITVEAKKINVCVYFNSDIMRINMESK